MLIWSTTCTRRRSWRYSTIPLYLYAAYSIETKGHSQWDPGISAFRTIISVVIEEKLHLSLARNLMLAIGAGDQITFYDRTFIPHYPSLMLHRLPDLELHLEPCTKDLMGRISMPLELPEKYDAPPQPGRYNTIGQFYKSIEDCFRYLADHDPEFWSQTPDTLKYKYTSTYWNYQGGGEPVCGQRSERRSSNRVRALTPARQLCPPIRLALNPG